MERGKRSDISPRKRTRQEHITGLMKNTQAVYSGLTYSKGGISNETQTDNIENRGFRV